MKATEQYIPLLLFIVLYEVVLPFESVNETLKCDHSNERYWAVLSCGGAWPRRSDSGARAKLQLYFRSRSLKLHYLSERLEKATVVLFIMLYKVLLPFESVDEILTCDNSNES